MTLPASLVMDDGTRYAKVTAAPGLPQLWMHKTDNELGGVRWMKDDVNGVPQVFILDDESMKLTQQWQYFIRAINYNMTPQKVAAIFGHFRAFANGTGFGDPNDPRKNYFTGENLDADEFPQLDKIRTCGRSVLTGTESEDSILVKTLDGNVPPALKPGKVYPTDISRVSIEDYVYTPRTHPWLFFVANNIQRDGETVPFSDDGGHYDWMGDNRPYTFLPHVSRWSVWYPKDKLIKLRAVDGVPSPYEMKP
jgi:hypothetical protein